ncbi:MAG: hypothetical protein HOC71_09575 [Candidatus Latescibacteria bacterium]|nr:hypothetical protein [Candidatus Latescibacterota bacterium]
MTYFLGVLAVVLITFLANKIGRFFGISAPFRFLSFFKLHYLAYGIILAFFFPDNFKILFEKITGTVFMFSLTWIGFYYGCSLEFRAHQRYSPKTLLFHMIEPVIIFLFTILAGTLYIYIKFNEIRHFDIVFILAVFCSLTLFKRHENPYHKGDYTLNPILRDLVPVRNIFAVTALSFAGSFFYGVDELSLFGNLFTGTFIFFMFHVIVGMSAGFLVSMLIKGSQTTESIPTIVIGVTALTGGIAYTFSLSPLFIGMVSGAFLINSTLKRLRTIEAVYSSHEHIEKIFMFFLGALLTPLIQSETFSPGLVLLSACGIFILRSSLKYILAYLWISPSKANAGEIILPWTGLTSQGIVAAGAALECGIQNPHVSTVFLIMIVLMVLNESVTGIYILKNR